MTTIKTSNGTTRQAATKLQELARLVRKARYANQQLHAQTQELARLRLGNELLCRLSWTMRRVYRVLVECLQVESAVAKRDFASLYGQIMSLADSLIEKVESRDRFFSTSFTKYLGDSSSDSIMRFIHKVRHDHAWVASALVALSASELESYLTTVDSRHRQTYSLRQSHRDVANPEDLQRTDLVYSLVLGIFAAPGMSQAEDELRCQLSSAIMSEMIKDNKNSSKCEKFCQSLLDDWCALHGWTIAARFETLLLEILQNGTRIMERAERKQLASASQSQNVRYYPGAHKKDEVEEEFFNDSARRILKLLDSHDLEGLPAGALSVSQAILAQIEETDRRHFETFIIINWFFHVYLLRVVVYPEQHGLLVDYHITESKRQSILCILHQRLVSSCIPTTKQAPSFTALTTIEKEIEQHIASIYARFRGTTALRADQSFRAHYSDNFFTARLACADHESGMANAFFHLCPRQISTLFTSLYSTRRSNPPMIGRSSLARQDSASSTSSAESLKHEHAKSSKSIFEFGAECIKEDVHNLIHEADEFRKCAASSCNFEKHSPATDLAMAMQDMSSVCCDVSFGIEEDHWEQIIVHADGLQPARNALDRLPSSLHDHDTVRLALEHLLVNSESNYEFLPSIKISSYFSKVNLQHETTDDHQRNLPPIHTLRAGRLMQRFMAAGKVCFDRHDYTSADLYYKALSVLQQKLNGPEGFEDFSPLLHGYCIEQEHEVENIEAITEEYQNLLIHALDHKAMLSQAVDDQISLFAKLRLRMWYQNDIRRSKMWTQSWEVVKCLYKMRTDPLSPYESIGFVGAENLPLSTGMSRTNSRDRRFPRFPRDNRLATPPQCGTQLSLMSADQSVYDVLVGPKESCIRNKLSGKQSLHTQDWLKDSDIHNFCMGEERLQRMCYEVDDVVRRLTKVNTHPIEEMDLHEAISSTIWKLELFSYEGSLFHIPHKAPESRSAEPPKHAQDDSSFSGLLRRGSAGDLLSLSKTASRVRGNSLGSLDNPRTRGQLSRVVSGTLDLDLDLSESPEKRSQASPVRSIELLRQNSIRPLSTALDSSLMAQIKPQDEQTIRDFVLQIQLGVTTLLLSDFADVLFWNGSETDSWINDEWTEVVSSRKTRLEQGKLEAAQMSDLRGDPSSAMHADVGVIAEPSGRPKHLRKKSLSVSQFFGFGSTMESLKSALAPPAIDIGLTRHKSGVELQRLKSSSSVHCDVDNYTESSTAPSTPMRSVQELSTYQQTFPLYKAYKEILHRFSMQPSPYEKLQALYDFESLVVASMRNSTEAAVTEPLVGPSTPHMGVAKAHAATSPAVLKHRVRKDSVDISKARIEELSVLPSSLPQIEPPKSSSVKTLADNPGTDSIVAEMQKILRNVDVRPKTLYKDLQLIASFIPAHILNMTDEGKVFWDFSLAALAVKREIIDALFDYASSKLSPSQPEASSTSPTAPIAEAVKMIINTAKDRHWGAMRELGMLLIEQPNLCPLVLPVFSDPAILLRGKKCDNLCDLEQLDRFLKAQAGRIWLEQAAAEGDAASKTWLSKYVDYSYR